MRNNKRGSLAGAVQSPSLAEAPLKEKPLANQGEQRLVLSILEHIAHRKNIFFGFFKMKSLLRIFPHIPSFLYYTSIYSGTFAYGRYECRRRRC